jgi:phage terminase small subunit
MLLLHPKYERFCRIFFEDGNATEAARDAGFSYEHAATQGYRLLKRPDIQARLAELASEEDAAEARAIAERDALRAKLAAMRATEAETLLAKLDPVYERRLAARDDAGVMKVIALQARIAGLLDDPTAAKRGAKGAKQATDDSLEIG